MTKQEALWFGAGFALAAVLSLSVNAMHFVPLSVAFGLLCFCSGAVLMQLLALRRQGAELKKQSLDSFNDWFKRFNELEEEKSKWEEEKHAWEEQRDE